MDILAQKFTFLTERFTHESGSEYLTDNQKVIMVSFRDNNYIMTILGQYYVVTSNINELINRLDDIQNGVKIEPNEGALFLKRMTDVK